MIKIPLLGLFLLIGCVSVTPVSQEADSSPQRFDPHAVNPIAIERVVSAVHRGDQIGVIKGGLLGVPHLTITAGGSQMNVTDSGYLDAIQHEFAVVDYPITTSPKELFKTGAADATRLRVAARIISVKANICYPLAGFGDLSSGTAEAFVEIEWQAYDSGTKSIILKTTTTGTGIVGDRAAAPGVQASELAAGMATRHFIAGPEFQRLSALQIR
jgi:hypothetical protein